MWRHTIHAGKHDPGRISMMRVPFGSVRTRAAIGFAILVTLLTGTPLRAQFWQAGVPGEDVGSISLYGGLLQPNTTYEDGSTFESGISGGVSVSYWPYRYFGMKALVIRSRTEGREGQEFSPLRFQNPTVWLYNLDLAVRYPIVGSSLALVPYLAGGVGGKTFRWDPSWPEQIGMSAPTKSAAAGFEIRPTGRNRTLGIVVEARGYNYGYTGFNYQWGEGIGRHIGDPQESTDLLFSVGLTFSR